jgi:hypothetical protein
MTENNNNVRLNLFEKGLFLFSNSFNCVCAVDFRGISFLSSKTIDCQIIPSGLRFPSG